MPIPDDDAGMEEPGHVTAASFPTARPGTPAVPERNICRYTTTTNLLAWAGLPALAIFLRQPPALRLFPLLFRPSSPSPSLVCTTTFTRTCHSPLSRLRLLLHRLATFDWTYSGTDDVWATILTT